MTECNPPALIENKGNWELYLDKLYAIYIHDFVENEFTYNSLPIYHNSKIEDGHESAFWHLIQRAESNGDRYPDFKRCERIAWIKYLISYCSNVCASIKIWEKIDKKTSRPRIYLWCESFDYVVILENRNTYFYFITAFNVMYQHERRKFEKDYQTWKKTKPLI